jgi:hypothetical protein
LSLYNPPGLLYTIRIWQVVKHVSGVEIVRSIVPVIEEEGRWAVCQLFPDLKDNLLRNVLHERGGKCSQSNLAYKYCSFDLGEFRELWRTRSYQLTGDERGRMFFFDGVF